METSFAGRLRCRIFSPDPLDVTLERRGFHAADDARKKNLEKVGTKFLEGFDYGMAGSGIEDIEAALETVEEAFRGFSYEGCAMALAVRDSLFPFRHWIDALLAGRGSRHIYMVYVGVGWAMARVPKMRWRSIMPDDRLLGWLALDGYGFHQAYFRTQQYVNEQYQTRIPLWQPQDYANRAMDQGIGRALWFINGSEAERVAAMIERFAAGRRADLWSGAALASVYAGGADEDNLTEMARLAGEYRSHAAQGAAFGAKARLLAGLVTPGTEIGVRAHCGMSVEEAAAVTDDARAGLRDTGGPTPLYEVWRGRVRESFDRHSVIR